MIAKLSGTISYKGLGYFILSVGGVGYKINAPTNLLSSLSETNTLEVWTYLSVRENALDLYGFREKKELDFFERLVQISGIGPRSALAILNLAPVEQLTKAIAAGDALYLTKVSGIGKKTAAKIILELKEKLSSAEGAVDSSSLKEEHEALEALNALGYTIHDAREALSRIRGTSSVNKKIKEALKLLSSGK